MQGVLSIGGPLRYNGTLYSSTFDRQDEQFETVFKFINDANDVIEEMGRTF